MWLINLNDAGLGVVVALAYVWVRRWPAAKAPRGRARAVLALAVVFRDATLFRETFTGREGGCCSISYM